MKRLLCIVFLCIITITVPCVAAAEESSYDVEYDMNMLSALGILSFDSATVKIDEGISQGEFLQMILNSIFENGVDEEFALDAARFMGIVTENYARNKLLAKTDAVAMAAAAIGYGGEKVYGTNVPAYLRERLTKAAFSSGGYLTYRGAVSLIAEMNREPLYYAYEFSDTYVRMKLDDNETILSYFRGIEVYEGIVEDNGYANLYGKTECDPCTAEVGGIRFRCQDDAFKELLGMNVELWTKKSNSGVYEVLFVSPYGNDMITISDEDYKGTDSDLTTISYYEGSKERSKKLADTAKLIYNGEACLDPTKEDFAVTNGKVELIDNDKGNGYDVVRITDYTTMVVQTVTSDREYIINDIENSGIDKLQINDPSKYIFWYKNGTATTASAVTNGCLLSVAKSKSGDLINIEISDNTIVGVIEEADKNRKIFKINGTEYQYTAEYEALGTVGEKYAAYPEFNREYTFYIDFRGNIAAVRLTTGSVKHGYMTNFGSEGVFDKEVHLKIFTEDGEWITPALAEKVRFNYKSGVKNAQVYDELLNSHFESQLVEYGVNDDGLVTELTIASSGSNADEGVFTSAGEYSSMRYLISSVSFNNEIFINSDAKLWFIPEDESAEDMYLVSDRSFLVEDYTYTFTPYNVDESKSSGLITVKLDSSVITRKTIMFMLVTDVGTRITENGDEVKFIRGYPDSYSESLIVLSDSINEKNIVPGDVIRLYLNGEGKVQNVIKLWTPSDGEVTNIPSPIHTSAAVVSGNVAKVFEKNNMISLRSESAQIPLRMVDNMRVLIYHRERNATDVGAVTDIVPGDYIIMFNRVSLMRFAVVVRD